eukprot:403358599
MKTNSSGQHNKMNEEASTIDQMQTSMVMQTQIGMIQQQKQEKKKYPNVGKYQHLDQVLALGGISYISEDEKISVFYCMPFAESGFFGLLTLKNAICFFSIIDLLLGLAYIYQFISEVYMVWTYYNINGPHHILTIFYLARMLSLPIGILGLLSLRHKHDTKLVKVYFICKLLEMFLFPAIGFLASYDMCQSYIFFDPCKQIFLTQSMFSVIRMIIYFYQAYVIRSYIMRLERGEFILANHGRAIIEMISKLSSKESQKKYQQESDIEMSYIDQNAYQKQNYQFNQGNEDGDSKQVQQLQSLSLRDKGYESSPSKKAQQQKEEDINIRVDDNYIQEQQQNIDYIVDDEEMVEVIDNDLTDNLGDASNMENKTVLGLVENDKLEVLASRKL